nr:unnamed protein product [Spirometra erinaceieuropaei]
MEELISSEPSGPLHISARLVGLPTYLSGGKVRCDVVLTYAPPSGEYPDRATFSFEKFGALSALCHPTGRLRMCRQDFRGSCRIKSLGTTSQLIISAALHCTGSGRLYERWKSSTEIT